MPGPYYATYTEETQTPLPPGVGKLVDAISSLTPAQSGNKTDGAAKKTDTPEANQDVPNDVTIGEILKDLAEGSNTDPYIRLKPKEIIDVRKDFIWTISPKHYILDKIPALILEEREQVMGSLISSALYYIGAFNNNIAAPKTTKLIEQLTAKLAGNSVVNMIPGASTATQVVGDAVTGGLDIVYKLSKLADEISSSSSDKAILSDKLKSYIGLYYTQPTGFKYVLPYFEDNFFGNKNTWSKSNEAKNMIGKALGKITEAVDDVVSYTNMLSPGTYIEQPKFYQYGDDYQSISVNFPLINTHAESATVVPYIQNYEFLWILAYQNKPYKTTFSRIMPPKLYSVFLPGIAYLPYAYISELTVNFVGSRRLLPVTLPTGAVFKAPIPEAYDVTIKLTSLISDVGNMMVDQFFTANTIQVVEETLIPSDNATRGRPSNAEFA